MENQLPSTTQVDNEMSIGEKYPELSLNTPDIEIATQAKKWEDSGKKLNTRMETKWKKSENYWKGKQYFEYSIPDDDQELMDNRIFSGFETFLPILTRQDPQPYVTGNGTDQGKQVAIKVGKHLQFLTDQLKIKLKLNQGARYWGMYYLGVATLEWNKEKNSIGVRIVLPEKLLLDDEATIEEGEYKGRFIGEYMKNTAKKLIELFPKHKEFLMKEVSDEENTEITYIQWSTPEMMFWQYKGKILDKIKNPHFNYETTQMAYNNFGVPTETVMPALNHFENLRMPYVFLSVYNLGKGVYDVTSFIEQSIAQQDVVNKRMRQIDKNVDNQNNSIVFYGIDQQRASSAGRAMRSGGNVGMPTQGKVERVGGTPLPSDVYNDLTNNKLSIDSMFATNAVTRGEPNRENTVRGKIIAKSSDESRIGFLAGYLEQFLDDMYNWMVQFMYVYYDEQFSATVIGADKQEEVVMIQKGDFVNAGKLLVSVKEGSMIPKDPLTQRNEAIDLYGMGALDIRTLLEKLDYENPIEVAKRVVLSKADPVLYLREVLGVELPQPQMPAGVEGGMPPEGAPPMGAPPMPTNAVDPMQNAVPQNPDVLSQVPIQ